MNYVSWKSMSRLECKGCNLKQRGIVVSVDVNVKNPNIWKKSFDKSLNINNRVCIKRDKQDLEIRYEN